MNDNVNHPSHYAERGSIECIEVIEQLNLGFHLGNALKYIWRHEEKGGIEDLKKARWYLNRYIANLETEADSNLKEALDGSGVSPEVLIQKDFLDAFRNQSRPLAREVSDWGVAPENIYPESGEEWLRKVQGDASSEES